MAVTLTNLDIINGIFSLLVLIVGGVVGLLIAMKYFKYKRNIFLYWGIAYIGFYCSWWGSGISFLFVIFTGNPLDVRNYILISNLLIPFLIILWMLGFTELIHQEKRKIVVSIYALITILADIVVIYYVFNNYRVLGHLTGIFDLKYELIMISYLLFINVSVTITGLIFAKDSLKSDNKAVKFQGKALIIAFLTYPIAGLIDGGLELNAIGVIIIRSLLIFGAFMFYIGFFVPKFVKKLLNLE